MKSARSTSTNRTVLWTVFLVVLVDLMGFGIVLPLLPFFAKRFDAGPVIIGLLYSCYSFMQLVFSPLWGAWSDRIGRRPIMLISTAGSCLSYILFAFSGSLSVLFASRILAGLMGGNISAAQAVVADITTPENRAKGMGLIGAAFGIGFTLGPALAGILSSHNHGSLEHPFQIPGFFAASLSLMSFLLIVFCMPETLNRNASSDSARVEKNGFFTARFWRAFSQQSSSQLPLLLIAGLILAIGHSSLYSSFPLFCGQVLLMDSHAIAMQFAVMGLVAVLIQGGLLRVLLKRFSERSLFLTGCLLMIVGLAGIPFAQSAPWLTFFILILAIGGSLNGPTLTSLLSKEASADQIGSVMGTSQGLSALGRVIGPTWGGWLFSLSKPLPFWATALIISSTIWIASRLKNLSKGGSA